MRNDKHLAIELRKKGKSYKQIEKELGIARSTLSGWFSDFHWSQVIKKDLTRKANYINHHRFRQWIKVRTEMWERWREEARVQARKEFKNLKDNPLFIAGIMLYWGEGDNQVGNGLVRLSNTNANMMRVYTRFLREICGVLPEKIRGEMILYPDLNENFCKIYWSSATLIPSHQFYKTQYIKGRHPTKRLAYGILIASFSSRQLKEKIFVWIDLFQKGYTTT